MKRTALIPAFIAATGAVAAYAAPRQHTVVKGDHLWALAGQYYQNHFRWKVIYSANQDKIKDPHWIYPGQIFTIPDVPGPEIGEIGARPIETAAVKVPPPEAPAPPAATPPAAAEASAPAPEAPFEPPLTPDSGAARRDDVSADFPPQLTGQYPSMTRLKAPAGWSEDGHIVEFKGREILAAQGDSINGKLDKGVTAKVGQLFAVYRRDAPQESEEDKKALYLQRVGWARVTKDLGDSTYTFLVLKSGDSLQVGDTLKREGQ